MIIKTQKMWISTYFLSAFIFALCLVLAFYKYDPLMLFHKPTSREFTLDTNMRKQASGIIKSLDYDSFIIGTSMLENTSANFASKLLGGRFANISLSGSDYAERAYLLKYALKNNARQIIYSLDEYAYRELGDGSKMASFSYLYDDGLEKIKIYFQLKYLICLLTWSKSSLCVGDDHTDIDMPNSWSGNSNNQARFGGLDNWFKASNNSQIKSGFLSISTAAVRIKNSEYELLGESELNLKISDAIKYIDDYLISYVREYPATKFNFIFPPYSRIRYAQWHQLNGTNAKVHEAVVRYFAEMATELNNLSVYGYEEQDFLDNIANYKDTGHYDQWVNDLMIEDIANNKSLLTSHNVGQYLEKSRSKALAFDLVGLGRKIDDYLKKSVE